MSRFCIFAHYDRGDIIDNYVIYYLECLKNLCDYLIFVSTSKLPDNELLKVKRLTNQVVLRENIGYDFMSYKVGLQFLENKDYDEIVMCNDSVYGPLHQLESVFEEMQAKNCDFWGITENHYPTYHIQSYFLVFRKNIILSEVFCKFWEGVNIKNEKSDIIDEYEIGISQTLINNNFRSRAYIAFVATAIDSFITRRITIKKVFCLSAWINLVREVLSSGREQKYNPTHFFWRKLIEEKYMPFLKIELLRDNPMNVNKKDYKNIIKKNTDYPIELLEGHLDRIKKKPK